MRVVLDTNILVRANPKASPLGLARDLLLKIVSEPHVLLLSPAILAEIRADLEALSQVRPRRAWQRAERVVVDSRLIQLPYWQC